MNQLSEDGIPLLYISHSEFTVLSVVHYTNLLLSSIHSHQTVIGMSV